MMADRTFAVVSIEGRERKGQTGNRTQDTPISRRACCPGSEGVMNSPID